MAEFRSSARTCPKWRTSSAAGNGACGSGHCAAAGPDCTRPASSLCRLEQLVAATPSRGSSGCGPGAGCKTLLEAPSCLSGEPLVQRPRLCRKRVMQDKSYLSLLHGLLRSVFGAKEHRHRPLGFPGGRSDGVTSSFLSPRSRATQPIHPQTRERGQTLLRPSIRTSM